MPVGYINVEGEVHYRLYQKGLVAVNPGKGKELNITVGE
jgi:hypothetical protein